MEIAKLVKYIRSQERDIIKLNDDIFLRNEIINILESQFMKNQLLYNLYFYNFILKRQNYI